ncbi:MAG: GNAT family N-acetyltransferase [Ornithinimicrobium sp.]|uniref:GNAT family N-acetyltransferase n=1 Tax=Ornithinimicrobium sp. TaxID=1977084 RepID=UPI003D9B1703
MLRITDLFPPLGLRITVGPLQLRGLSDEHLPELCELAEAGIHAPERMPFAYPWTDAPAGELPRIAAAYHWRCRAAWSPGQWSLQLGVWHDGQLVGCQGLETSDYLVTRSAETGSWLGLAHQGRGIGTAMRRAICAFAFDHLDAQEITSGAFTDNPASLAISRKVGYTNNGIRRMKRREDDLAHNQQLTLTPDRLVRGEHPLQVEGLAAVRASIGLADEVDAD